MPLKQHTTPQERWGSELSWKDRKLLRLIVRKVHFEYFPERLQTDKEADKIIESFGPIVCEHLIRDAVRKGLT